MVTADTSVDKARWPESVGDLDGANSALSEVESKPVKHRRKLTPEQKHQIFLETQRGDIPVAGVLRKWGIHSSDLTRIRAQVRQGALVDKGAYLVEGVAEWRQYTTQICLRRKECICIGPRLSSCS